MTEVTAERNRADRALRAASPDDAPTATQLRDLIEGLGDMVAVLANTNPARRSELYEALGLRLTWHPQDKKVLVEATPTVCWLIVSEGGLAQIGHPTSDGLSLSSSSRRPGVGLASSGHGRGCRWC